MEKSLHSALFEATKDENVYIKASSLWLKQGNNSAQSEALYCLLQDRNMFLGKLDMCPHCNESKKTVDILASRCGRHLHINHKERHDEVVRSIHFRYAREYGFAKSKKLRTHKLGLSLVNEKVTIRNDENTIKDVKISYNKPDIFIHDKAKT